MKRKKKAICGLHNVQVNHSMVVRRMAEDDSTFPENVPWKGGFGLSNILCEALIPPWQPANDMKEGDIASIRDNPERCWRCLEDAVDALSMKKYGLNV